MTDEKYRDVGGYDLDAGSEDSGLEVVQTGYTKYRRPDEPDPEEEAARLRKAKRAMVITVVAIAAVAAFTLWMSFGRANPTDEEKLQQIASLNEATYLFAQEDTSAIGMIQRRFPTVGDMLPFTDGVVVRYLFLNYPAEIWVGVCNLQESAADAYSLLLQETDPELNDAWRSQSSFERGQTAITQVVGHGQRNYFFRDSNMIVWIASDSLTAPYALQATLNTNLREWIDSVRLGGGF
jgi:type II secretory pathway pseudopilin PulG